MCRVMMNVKFYGLWFHCVSGAETGAGNKQENDATHKQLQVVTGVTWGGRSLPWSWLGRSTQTGQTVMDKEWYFSRELKDAHELGETARGEQGAGPGTGWERTGHIHSTSPRGGWARWRGDMTWLQIAEGEEGQVWAGQLGNGLCDKTKSPDCFPVRRRSADFNWATVLETHMYAVVWTFVSLSGLCDEAQCPRGWH